MAGPARSRMKRAFSLVELIIVVAVLGILAAIVVPQFQGFSRQAKEAVAKDSLHLLRGAIELYTTQHDGVPPGYKDDDVSTAPGEAFFHRQIVVVGHYLSAMPENPFNNLSSIRVFGNAEDLPVAAGGGSGWVYQPATKTIKLDWPGADKKGTSYYEY